MITDNQNEHYDPQSYAAMLARMDTQLIQLNDKVERFLKVIESHDQRISDLERWRGKLIGSAAIVGALAGYALPKIIEHVFK